MNNRTIYYIAIYANDERYCALSAKLKIDGIIAELVEKGYQVEMISLASTHGPKTCKKNYLKLKDFNLKLFTTLGRKNFLIQCLDYIYVRLQAFFYILKKIKHDDIVIVYHSLAYMQLVRMVKKIKNFNLILELEELYGDVIQSPHIKKREIKYAKVADSYIFPTELLKESIEVEKKPYVVIHGTYKNEEIRTKKVNDGLVRIVYAGTLDKRKGSLEAIRAAEFLDERYCIYILGSGTKEELQLIKDCIEEMKHKTNATIIYKGILYGEEYVKFIQGCDIGLCTQDPNADFTLTSFPSKILSYLSNGLHVLCIDIEAIKTSKVAEVLNFYHEQSPQEIAKSIKGIKLDDTYDSRKFVEKLFCTSSEELDNLVKIMRKESV